MKQVAESGISHDVLENELEKLRGLARLNEKSVQENLQSLMMNSRISFDESATLQQLEDSEEKNKVLRSNLVQMKRTVQKLKSQLREMREKASSPHVDLKIQAMTEKDIVEESDKMDESKNSCTSDTHKSNENENENKDKMENSEMENSKLENDADAQIAKANQESSEIAPINEPPEGVTNKQDIGNHIEPLETKDSEEYV